MNQDHQVFLAPGFSDSSLDHLPHPRLLWVRYLVVEVCGKIIVSGGKGVKIRFNLFNKLIAQQGALILKLVVC